MPLLTVERYREITGDKATLAPDVVEAIAQAEEDLAEALDRPLEEAERTESMWPTRDGWLWPKATPILAADGHTINGIGLEGWPSRWFGCSPPSVTYTGGWVDRTENPDAPNRLPRCIEVDLAWAARADLCPDADGIDLSQIPIGASNVRLGDAGVGFAGDGFKGAPASADHGGPKWSRRTLRYRYRVTRSA